MENYRRGGEHASHDTLLPPSADRWKWDDLMGSDPLLSARAKLVGHKLAWHRNEHTGEIFPLISTLATETGLNRRAIGRALHELLQGGWIIRLQRYFRASTVYALALPAKETGIVSQLADSANEDNEDKIGIGKKTMSQLADSANEDTGVLHNTQEKNINRRRRTTMVEVSHWGERDRALPFGPAPVWGVTPKEAIDDEGWADSVVAAISVTRSMAELVSTWETLAAPYMGARGIFPFDKERVRKARLRQEQTLRTVAA